MAGGLAYLAVKEKEAIEAEYGLTEAQQANIDARAGYRSGCFNK